MLGSTIHHAHSRFPVLYSSGSNDTSGYQWHFRGYLDEFIHYACKQTFFCITKSTSLDHKPGGLKCVTRACYFLSFVLLYQLHGWRNRSCNNTLHGTGGRHIHFLWKTIKTIRRFWGRRILHLIGDVVYDTGRWWNICLAEAVTKAWKGLVYLAFDIPAPALPGFSCPSLQLPVLYWRFGSMMVGIVHKHILQLVLACRAAQIVKLEISNG